MIDSSICLNPDCLNQSQRLLSSSPNRHKGCEGWILQDVNTFLTQKISKSHDELIDQKINLFEEPIKSLADFHELQEWPFQFNLLIDDLKQSIVNELENQRQKKLQQFSQLMGFLSSASLRVQQFLQKGSKEKQMFELLKKVKTVGKVTIYNRQQIINNYHSKFLPCLRTLLNSIQTIQEVKQNEDKRRQEAIGKTTEYLNDENVCINEKIQKLTSIFKLNMVEVSKMNSKKWKTSCFLCKQSMYGLDQKNKVLDQLLEHLKEKHQEEVYLQYMNKVLKYQLQEMNLNVLLQELQKSNYQKVYVIDRQNAGNFQKPYKSQSDYYIEVVNKMNKNLAKGKYMIAGSQKKDAADILIVFTICEILRVTNAEVVLITGDHFGQVLEEIINDYFGNRFTSILRNEFIL